MFNRILRHNLRNQLDVIRSHAEELADGSTETHADRIIAAVDELTAIGTQARKADKMLAMGDELSEIEVSQSLRATIKNVEKTDADVTVKTDLSAATLLTNGDVLQTAVESALENAVEYAESLVTVSGEDNADEYVVVIDDDGDGIPEEEVLPIKTGTETDFRHGRGLGLWQLRWSVDQLNGELSFDTTNGTTVRIVVPDQNSV